MSKGKGGFIGRDDVNEPTENFENSAASGVWSLTEVLSYVRDDVWPTQGNTAPIGLFAAGSGTITNIDKVIIATLGNSTDFGDTTISRGGGAACGIASSTRGIFAGGYDGNASAKTNVIEYVTISTASNATDFGDLTEARQMPAGASSSTRGVIAAGGASSLSNVIDYITIASTGNATDFGDTTQARDGPGGVSSSTRGVFGGGYKATHPTSSNVMDYITIASTGNASDFGDLTVARNYVGGGISSGTRGIFQGGGDVSFNGLNHIDYITIASTGNATDFGDLLTSKYGVGGTSSSTRGVMAGGSSDSNVIQYITIASTGNAADFGDLITGSTYTAGCSNVHGGLQ